MQQPALSPEYGKYEGIGTGTHLRPPVVAVTLIAVTPAKQVMYAHNCEAWFAAQQLPGAVICE